MKYSILIFDTPETAARFQGPEGARYMSQWQPFIKALTDAGIYVAGAGLQPPDTATTLRFNGDKRLVQDGPYADTKEQLGGYYMIEAPDMDAALSWAARCPTAGHGTVEVRPLWY